MHAHQGPVPSSEVNGRNFIYEVFASFLEAIESNIQFILALSLSSDVDDAPRNKDGASKGFMMLLKLFGVMSKYDIPYFVYGLTRWRRTGIEGRKFQPDPWSKRKSIISKILDKRFSAEKQWLSSHFSKASHLFTPNADEHQARKQVLVNLFFFRAVHAIVRNAPLNSIDHNISRMLNNLVLTQLLDFHKTNLSDGRNELLLLESMYVFMFELSTRTYKMTTGLIIEMLEVKLRSKCNLTYILRSIAYLDCKSQLTSTSGAALVSRLIDKLSSLYIIESREVNRVELANSLSRLLDSFVKLPNLEHRILKISEFSKNIVVMSKKVLKKTRNTTYLTLLLNALMHVYDSDFLTKKLPAAMRLLMISQKSNQQDSELVYKFVRLIYSYISTADLSKENTLKTLNDIVMMMWDFTRRGLNLYSSVCVVSPITLTILMIYEKNAPYATSILNKLLLLVNSPLGDEKLLPPKVGCGDNMNPELKKGKLEKHGNRIGGSMFTLSSKVSQLLDSTPCVMYGAKPSPAELYLRLIILKTVQLSSLNIYIRHRGVVEDTPSSKLFGLHCSFPASLKVRQTEICYDSNIIPGSPLIPHYTESKNIASWLISEESKKCFQDLLRPTATCELTHCCCLSRGDLVEENNERVQDSNFTFTGCIVHSDNIVQMLDLFVPTITEIINNMVLQTFFDPVVEECVRYPSDGNEIYTHLISTSLENIPVLTHTFDGKVRTSFYERLAIYSLSAIKQVRFSTLAYICKILWMPICSPYHAAKCKTESDMSVYSFWFSVISSVTFNMIETLKKRVCNAESELHSHESTLGVMSSSLSVITNTLRYILDKYRTLKKVNPRRADSINSVLSFEVADNSNRLILSLEEGASILLISETPQTRSEGVKILEDVRSISHNIIALIESTKQLLTNGTIIELLENMKLSDVLNKTPSIFTIEYDFMIPSLCRNYGRCFLSLNECNSNINKTMKELILSQDPVNSKIWNTCIPSVLKRLYDVNPHALSKIFNYSTLFISVVFSHPSTLRVEGECDEYEPDDTCDNTNNPQSVSSDTVKNYELFSNYKQCGIHTAISLSLLEIFDVKVESIPKEPVKNEQLESDANSNNLAILRSFLSSIKKSSMLSDKFILYVLPTLNMKIHPIISKLLSKTLLSTSSNLKEHINGYRITFSEGNPKALGVTITAGIRREIRKLIHLLTHIAPLFRDFKSEDLFTAAEACMKLLMDGVDIIIDINKRVASGISLNFARLVCLICIFKNNDNSNVIFPSAKLLDSMLPILEKCLMSFLSADLNMSYSSYKINSINNTTPKYEKPNISSLLMDKIGYTTLAYLKAILSTFEWLMRESADGEYYNIDLYKLFTWIDAVLQHSDPLVSLIGEKCLKNIYLRNTNNHLLLRILIDRCYKMDCCSYPIATKYFSILSKFSSYGSTTTTLIMKNFLPMILPLIIYYLSLYELSVRVNVIVLIDNLNLTPSNLEREIKLYLRKYLNIANSTNSTPEELIQPWDQYTANNLQDILNKKFSEMFPSLRLHILSNLTDIVVRLSRHPSIPQGPSSLICHHNHSYNTIERMLFFMISWLKKLQLHTLATISDISSDRPASDIINSNRSDSQIILCNLFYLTILLYRIHRDSVSNIWKTLVSNDGISCDNKLESNVTVIVNYTIDNVLSSKCQCVFECSKFIINSIGHTDKSEELFKCLMKHTNPLNTPGKSPSMYYNYNIQEHGTLPTNLEHVDLSGINIQKTFTPYADNLSQIGYISNLKPNLNLIIKDSPKCNIETACELSLIYTYESCINHCRYKAPEFPKLLHALYTHLDSSVTSFSTYFLHFLAKIVAINCLVYCSKNTHMTVMEIEGLVNSVNSNQVPINHPIKDQLIRKLLLLLNRLRPDLESEWGLTALNWSVNCQNIAISSTSLDIFKIISPSISDEMMEILASYIMRTLHLCVGENTYNISNILSTLQYCLCKGVHCNCKAVLKMLDVACGCTNSCNENIRGKGMKFMTNILYYIHESKNLISGGMCPVAISSDSADMLNIVIDGIMSSRYHDTCLELLNAIVLSDLNICQITNPLKILVLLVNTPNFIYGMSEDANKQNVKTYSNNNHKRVFMKPEYVAQLVASKLLKGQKNEKLAALFSSYSSDIFKKMHNFIPTLVNGLELGFFPKYLNVALDYLLQLASCTYKKDLTVYLTILKTIFDYNRLNLNSRGIKVDRFVKTLFYSTSPENSEMVLKIIDTLISCHISTNARRSDIDSDNTFSISTKPDNFCAHSFSEIHQQFEPNDVSLSRNIQFCRNAQYLHRILADNTNYNPSITKLGDFNSTVPSKCIDHDCKDDTQLSFNENELFLNRGNRYPSNKKSLGSYSRDSSKCNFTTNDGLMDTEHLYNTQVANINLNNQTPSIPPRDVIRSLDNLDAFFKNRTFLRSSRSYSYFTYTSTCEDITFDSEVNTENRSI